MASHVPLPLRSLPVSPFAGAGTSPCVPAALAVAPLKSESVSYTHLWVGRFDLAVKLLEELQFDESLILTNDIEKLRAFIGV